MGLDRKASSSQPPRPSKLEVDWNDFSSVLEAAGEDTREVRATAAAPEAYESYARRLTVGSLTEQETQKALSVPQLPSLDGLKEHLSVTTEPPADLDNPLADLEASIRMLDAAQRPSGPHAIPLELPDLDDDSGPPLGTATPLVNLAAYPRFWNDKTVAPDVRPTVMLDPQTTKPPEQHPTPVVQSAGVESSLPPGGLDRFGYVPPFAPSTSPPVTRKAADYDLIPPVLAEPRAQRPEPPAFAEPPRSVRPAAREESPRAPRVVPRVEEPPRSVRPAVREVREESPRAPRVAPRLDEPPRLARAPGRDESPRAPRVEPVPRSVRPVPLPRAEEKPRSPRAAALSDDAPRSLALPPILDPSNNKATELAIPIPRFHDDEVDDEPTDSMMLEFRGEGDAFDLVEARSTRPEPQNPMTDLRDRYAAGDYSGALLIAESILTSNPKDPEALHFAESCREILIKMYTARLGSTGQVPRIAMRPEEIRWLTLDHRTGFLLSCIDGYSSIEELLDVSGMSRLDTLRILSALVQQQIIQLKSER